MPPTHRGSSDPWESASATDSGRDAEYMRRAIELAREGWGQTAPNPMVGAVVVRDDAIVGEGWHERFGEAHAEVNAIAMAGDRARGATLYVTLEPCNHHGKTPPCTKAILEAGITRVVAGVKDPTAAAGGGAAFLRDNGVAVDFGVMTDTIEELIAPFLYAAGAARPFVTLKLALSREGSVADVSRKKRWLTSEEARGEVHRLRADADAIAVGAGTVVCDDPQLTVRGSVLPRKTSARVIFDRRGLVPLASQVVVTARQTPTFVVTSPGGRTIPDLRAAGVSVIEASDTETALRALRGGGIQHLFVEGGASLSRSLLGDGLVDRLIIFQTQVALGAGGPKPFERIEELDVERVVESRSVGADQMTVYRLKSK